MLNGAKCSPCGCVEFQFSVYSILLHGHAVHLPLRELVGVQIFPAFEQYTQCGREHAHTQLPVHLWTHVPWGSIFGVNVLVFARPVLADGVQRRAPAMLSDYITISLETDLFLISPTCPIPVFLLTLSSWRLGSDSFFNLAFM